MRLPFFWLASTVVLLGAVSNFAIGQSGNADQENGPSTSQLKLLREGTRIELRTALCRSLGDRLVIDLGHGERPMTALENLTSQRVLKAVLDDASDSQWTISGLVTEFQDRNFILLDRVVRSPQR
jgi:hypothetical protein